MDHQTDFMINEIQYIWDCIQQEVEMVKDMIPPDCSIYGAIAQRCVMEMNKENRSNYFKITSVK